MTIDDLQLEPLARQAAIVLKKKHPKLEFTSGRRTIRQQAYAMAGNIAFDVKPVILNSKKIKTDIQQLPSLHKFLDHEGGHIRSHAQFV